MSSSWIPTNIVLDGFFDLLACRKCKKIPERPTRYINCGHFFCDTCIYGQLACFRCKIPVKANELQPDRTVAGLIEYCQIIRNVISEIQPEDSKTLANVVYQFAAAQREVVPETDTESEDEIVESTPPGARGGLKSLQSKATEYADHSQITKSQEESKKFGPETAGFVGPARYSPGCRKKNANPEIAEYVGRTNKSYGEKEFEQETAGFVSPTQFSPCVRKINLASKIAEYVDHTRITESNEGKGVEPETLGFVDPTQITPCHLKKNSRPLIAGFAEPTKTNECFVTKNFEPETAGYVDPTQFSPRQRKLKLQTKTIDHAHRSNKNLDNVSQEKKSNEPDSPVHEPARNAETVVSDTLGYVDQTPPSHRKKRILARSREFLARTVQTQQHLKTSIYESPSYVDPTQVNLRGRKLDLAPEIMPRVGTEKNQPHEETSRRMVYPESESAGYVDPTQIQLCRKNDAENEHARYMNSTPLLHRDKNDDYHPDSIRCVASPIENCQDKMEIEGPGVKNASSHRSKEDSSFVVESVEMEEITASSHLKEIRIFENNPNGQDSPMETDELHYAATIEQPRGSKENISNTNPSVISRNSPDRSNEHLEKQEETPLNKLRRIRSMALSRNNRIRRHSNTSSVAGESSPVIADMREKESEKQLHIGNVSTEGTNVLSINGGSSFSDVANFGKDVEKFVGISPPKLRRRTRSSTIEEKTHAVIEDTSRTRDRMDEPKILETEATTPNRMNLTNSFAELRKKKIDTPARSSRAMENEAPQKLKSVENLENEDATPTRKCKEKLIKFKSRRDNAGKSTPPVRKTVPKNVNKRNAKGETPLHTACVKGQKDYAKDLIEAGANPNTKDNANWTPLQEAVNLGHREICEMLLQAGASANTPAMENRTALHDAAAGDKLEEATLLLRFNANRNVYDKYGKRPVDYAVSDEMRALLADENKVENIIDDIACCNSTLNQSIIVPNAKVVVLPSNLTNKNRKLLTQLASKLKVEVATTFRPSVTHVIVETNERNVTKLTYDVMVAILQGKWILNSQWITISTDLNDISEIDLELFEVRGAPNSETPLRARSNEEKQNPRLFNNCFFYFALGARGAWNYEQFEFTKENLAILVHAGQGEILNREPDPEDVKDYKLTPFHVSDKPIHPLHRCSHYIIYMPGKDEPRVKYSMPHIKTLPVGWFLECIEKFALVDPSLMGIS